MHCRNYRNYSECYCADLYSPGIRKAEKARIGTNRE